MRMQTRRKVAGASNEESLHPSVPKDIEDLLESKVAQIRADLLASLSKEFDDCMMTFTAEQGFTSMVEVKESQLQFRKEMEEALGAQLSTIRKDVVNDAQAVFQQETWDELSGGIRSKLMDLASQLSDLRHEVSDLSKRVGTLADNQQPNPALTDVKQVESSVRHLSQQLHALAVTIDGPKQDPLLGNGNPSLTGKAATSMVPDHDQLLTETEKLGPEVPGLIPLKTREPAFDKVLSYRAYRLEDTRATLEQGELKGIGKMSAKIRSYNPSFEEFDARDPIDIIRFLFEFKDASDAMGVSEAAAVKLLPWFLRSDAKAYITSTQQKGKLLGGSSRDLDWPHAVHALLTRYATDDVLSTAYDEVTRVTQHQGEDESAFADRLQTAALRCANVFSERDLVNYFLKGLQPGIRSTVSVNLSRSDEQDLLAVRRIAQAHGETLRAARSENKPKLSQTRESARNRRALVLPQPGVQPGRWSDTSSEAILSDPHWESTNRVLFVEEAPGQAYVTPHQLPSTPSSIAETVDMTATTPVPSLSPQQEELAKTMIPSRPIPWTCLGCRKAGHLLYSCPYLPPAVSAFFAYMNYIYQQQPEQVLLRQQRRREGAGGVKVGSSTRKGSAAPIIKRPETAPTPRKTIGFVSQEGELPKELEHDPHNPALIASKPIRVEADNSSSSSSSAEN